jgi:hypothetical protein
LAHVHVFVFNLVPSVRVSGLLVGDLSSA